MSLLSDLEALEEKIVNNELSHFEMDRGIGLLIGGWERVPEDHAICQAHRNCNFLNDNGNIFPDSSGAIYESYYTESIDSAVRLLEYALPNWGWSLSNTGVVSVFDLDNNNNLFDSSSYSDYNLATKLCLAIIIARIYLELDKPIIVIKNLKEDIEVFSRSETRAFAIWAFENGYGVLEYPFPRVFANSRLNDARDAWKAALKYVRGLIK